MAPTKASGKATRSMASCIFHYVALLEAIELKAESLNDTSVDEYYKIEGNSKLTSCKFGKKQFLASIII